MAKAKET